MAFRVVSIVGAPRVDPRVVRERGKAGVAELLRHGLAARVELARLRAEAVHLSKQRLERVTVTSTPLHTIKNTRYAPIFTGTATIAQPKI